MFQKSIQNIIGLHKRMRTRRDRTLRSIFLAIKFKILYRLKHCREYGPVIDDRFQHLIRRGFTVYANNFTLAKTESLKHIVADFVSVYSKKWRAKVFFKRYFDKIRAIQRGWRHCQEGRKMMLSFWYRRLMDEHGFIMNIYK